VGRAADWVTRAVRGKASVIYGQAGRKDVPGLADNCAENLVVINAIPGPDGSLAVLERIPGEGDVRGDVVGVGLVNLESSGEEILEAGDVPSEDRIGDLFLDGDVLLHFGRVEGRFDAAFDLPRDGIEFVSQSERQREIRADANLIGEEDVVLPVP